MIASQVVLLDSILEILYRSITVLSPTTVCPDCILASTLVLLKVLHLLRVHVLHNLISLPLLEREAHTLMRVIFVVGLILVILQLNEVGVDSRGIEGQGNESVNRGGLWNEFEGPGLYQNRPRLAVNSYQSHH